MYSFIVYVSSICLLVANVGGFLTGRRVVKTLSVSNGGEFGQWGPPHYCADGAYATGYNMKV